MAWLQRKYKYEPLPQSNSIRYLILQPGAGDDPLVCSLRTASIEKAPQFEAISYVWGSKERTHEIICDRGRFSRKRIAITANLRDALKGVRLPDKARFLWADSICIDQDNRKEQGHQVALMGQIYQKATKVLIFVGINAGQHGLAVKSLLAEIRKITQGQLENTSLTEDALPYPAKDDPLLTDRRWTSMKALLKLPWFSRGWVVQEAGLAAEATVIWGDTEFDWLDLIWTYLWLTWRAHEVRKAHDLQLNQLHILLYQRRHKQEASSFYPQNYFSCSQFHDLLGCARTLNLTDERNHVYAFIGLQSDVAIEPDYEASYLQVYIDFARKYLLSTHDLTLLDEIQHTEDTIASEYPTWVPRWNMETNSSFWHSSSPVITSPSVSPAPLPTIVTGNAIKVRVVLFDTVQFRFPLGERSGILDRIGALWQRLSDLPWRSSFPMRSRRLLFVQTLAGRSYEGIWEEWTAHEAAFMLYLQQVRREDWLDAAELARLERRAMGGSADYFIDVVGRSLGNRSFVVTNRGYYGCAPSTIREEDICTIIFGTRAPFALRATEKQSCYKVLGNISIASNKDTVQRGEVRFPGLGREKSRDWLELGLQQEDILLV